MEKTQTNDYFVVKDAENIDYLCPVDAVKNRAAVTDQELEECVEKDVVGRYSGNIDIESV